MRLNLSTTLGATFAIVAFAGNSLLARAALGGALIDAAGFTAIRLSSGALMLVAISGVNRRPWSGGSWAGGIFLFGYAAAFSGAYRSVTAATGALLLFGAVQCTMLVAARVRGERQTPLQWVGLAMSVSGLVALLSPQVENPDPLGAVLMLLAGVCWGGYSLIGVASTAPLYATTGNFMRASLPAAAWGLFSAATTMPARPPWVGVALAVCSGAVTSGVGYVLWYRVLPRLGSFRAAVCQLAVPAVTALAAAAVLSEALSLRLIGLEALVLGGVALGVIGTARRGTESR